LLVPSVDRLEMSSLGLGFRHISKFLPFCKLVQ
jgi:hypothetical protein